MALLFVYFNRKSSVSLVFMTRRFAGKAFSLELIRYFHRGFESNQNCSMANTGISMITPKPLYFLAPRRGLPSPSSRQAHLNVPGLILISRDLESLFNSCRSPRTNASFFALDHCLTCASLLRVSTKTNVDNNKKSSDTSTEKEAPIKK
jgi:hypothetical protein